MKTLTTHEQLLKDLRDDAHSALEVGDFVLLNKLVGAIRAIERWNFDIVRIVSVCDDRNDKFPLCHRCLRELNRSNDPDEGDDE